MAKVARQWASTEETRQRILDAAVEVFVENGFNCSKISDIVEASGCSIGSIYHHFGGKDELFQAISDRVKAEVEARADKDWIRTLLWVCWERRHEVRILLNRHDWPRSYVPPGRQAFYEILGENPLTRAMVSLVRESVEMLLETDDHETANTLVEATMKWLGVVQAVGF